MSSPTPVSWKQSGTQVRLSRVRDVSSMPSGSFMSSPCRALLGPPPACFNRYSSATPGPSNTIEVEKLRNQAFQKLQDTWDDIIERYTNVDQEMEDEIDLFTGEVVVDRGRIKGMDSWEFGGDDDDEGEAESNTPLVTRKMAPTNSSDDEDEFAGWGESSGLDWQVVDPELLARVQRAADAQKQWTEADKDDLESFMQMEQRRAQVDKPTTRELAPLRSSPSTPARVFRRTIYSEKPEGFFPSSSANDSESEDELGIYRPGTGARQLVASRSMPEIVGERPSRLTKLSTSSRSKSDQEFFMPSSPSTSRCRSTERKSSVARAAGLSAKARGKLPATALANMASSHAQRRHSVHADRSLSAIEQDLEAQESVHAETASASSRVYPVTPTASLSAFRLSSGSISRRLRRLSVRFSPVVLNYPPSHNVVRVNAIGGPLHSDTRSRAPLRQHTPHHSATQQGFGESADLFTPTYIAPSEPSRCAECLLAGGARALGAATCSGSNEEVECELAAAGRAAEQNRLTLALAQQKQSETTAHFNPHFYRGVRKRSRIILSPEESDSEPPQPIVRSLPSTPKQRISNRSKSLGALRKSAQSEPRNPNSSRSIYGHPLITAATANIRLCSPPVVDSDDSDDELALTDNPRTEVRTASPKEVAAYARRQSLRPRSPSVFSSVHLLGLPTPPPSRASCQTIRSPLSMLPPPPPNRQPLYSSGSPSKRQRRSPTLPQGASVLQQLSTPAPSKSPTPQSLRPGLIRSKSGSVCQ